MKNITSLFVFLAVLVICAGFASAANLEITSLEINNKDIDPAMDSSHTNNYKYERGEELDIDVCVKALDDVTDAQIEADIYGYRYSNRDDTRVSDTSDTFDLDSGDRDCETLSLQIPEKADVDYYKLRIRIGDRDSISFEKTYQLHVKGIDRSSAVEIKDYSLDPESVIAGRAFTAMVKIKNLGTSDLEDLKVTVSIPELNVKTSEFMDELDADESKTFEDLLLRVPECTKAGDYDVRILVEFDEYEETETMATMKVISGTCGSTGANTEDKTVITVPGSQEVSRGNGVVYPVMITNLASTAKTYTLTVSGVSSWAAAKIDPSSVIVVPAGQSKTAYLYVSANKDAELGDKAFTLNVDSGNDDKQIALVAKVSKGTGSDISGFRKALEIGLVVLVIILIILGLIIGFNKLKENKNESEPYY